MTKIDLTPSVCVYICCFSFFICFHVVVVLCTIWLYHLGNWLSAISILSMQCDTSFSNRYSLCHIPPAKAHSRSVMTFLPFMCCKWIDSLDLGAVNHGIRGLLERVYYSLMLFLVWCQPRRMS